MNKQQQTVLNMAGFIKSQSLTLLEKLDALDADEQAAMCENCPLKTSGASHEKERVDIGGRLGTKKKKR
ncbi:Rop family plasmid primer RNA-binding protein, partial [Pseudomonas aeruginosa]|uniref:Rop family plasmid primer RNA-binding protein n=1 Tax=Pseudomonas aeruginosa TaxID=287 RepID=UPI003F75FEA7